MMISLAIPVILIVGLRLSYQQTPSKELTFCLDKPTTSSTLQTFWQDATSNDCELDAIRLIDQYTKLTHSDANTGDRCSLLLIHQMRKKLINVASQQLEEAFIMRTLKETRDVNRLLEEIHVLDRRISEAVWERAINEIYLFVEQEDVVEAIFQMQSDELQVFALQFLLSKTRLSSKGNKNMLPLITYTLSKVIKTKKLAPASLANLNAVYNRLPQELRALYGSSKSSAIGLLNRAHWEYLYAPRDNGPDTNRRLPLTWSKEKNSTDVDGHFLVEFNVKGLVAFGSRFGAAPKYLYADIENQAPYFWIGSGNKSSLWWEVIWSLDFQGSEGERSVALQNDESKEFLCASDAYDENRRYVILMAGQESAERHDCQWLMRGF